MICKLTLNVVIPQVVALCDYPGLLDKSETHALFRYYFCFIIVLFHTSSDSVRHDVVMEPASDTRIMIICDAFEQGIL